MSSLLAIYGEGVARCVNFFCLSGCVIALAVAGDCWTYDTRFDLARKCLWVATFCAVVLILFPGPDFFKALDGRP